MTALIEAALLILFIISFLPYFLQYTLTSIDLLEGLQTNSDARLRQNLCKKIEWVSVKI